MIAEWLTSLRISCAPHIRRMGYHKELVAISYRADRQRAHWRAHLQNTHDSIISAIEKCPRKNVIVILGAGSLLDIPLAEICRHFNHVYLVDVVFLPSARKIARQFANCHLISTDITGIAEAVYNIATLEPLVLPTPKDPVELAAITPDLTLSVNILSQLPILPKRYLERHFAEQSDQVAPQIEEFCQKLITHHLDWLKSLPGQVCLISDVEITTYRGDNDQNETIDEQDPLHGISLTAGGAQWIWDIAPPGEQAKGVSVRHLVQAIDLKTSSATL